MRTAAGSTQESFAGAVHVDRGTVARRHPASGRCSGSAAHEPWPGWARWVDEAELSWHLGMRELHLGNVAARADHFHAAGGSPRVGPGPAALHRLDRSPAPAPVRDPGTALRAASATG